VEAALIALGRLDREHAGVYFHILWNGSREPMRRALEKLVMERQTEGKTPGKLDGLRDALRRLLGRAGIRLTEDDHTRIQACTDAATLDRWIENVLGAKTAADVFC